MMPTGLQIFFGRSGTLMCAGEPVFSDISTYVAAYDFWRDQYLISIDLMKRFLIQDLTGSIMQHHIDRDTVHIFSIITFY